MPDALIELIEQYGSLKGIDAFKAGYEATKRDTQNPDPRRDFQGWLEQMAVDLPEIFQGVDLSHVTASTIDLLRKRSSEFTAKAKEDERRSVEAFFDAAVRATIKDKDEMSPEEIAANDEEQLTSIMSLAGELQDAFDASDCPAEMKKAFGVKVNLLCIEALEYWAARGCRYGFAEGRKPEKEVA